MDSYCTSVENKRGYQSVIPCSRLIGIVIKTQPPSTFTKWTCESAKVSVSQVSVYRTQLTKGGYTTLTTMQGHLVMQGSTLLRHTITPHMHTHIHTHAHTHLQYAVYYSKAAHMTPTNTESQVHELCASTCSWPHLATRSIAHTGLKLVLVNTAS